MDRRRALIPHPPPLPLWELSLLAIAVGQVALKLNVPPSSRASSAPTLISGAHGIGVHRNSLWERACSR
ncbi:hypothetical protein C1C98_19730 [Pseudomonas ogarae]|uniref:Uncharacterized protein n=1 Tax=Pseudomonas ogarae (strain DSM 112162 / CECT 30235 / F113) TaxID=1114970 RepID=A0ABN5GG09_PSEO1|nr:hypothetical protein C1C98_19730 [Pseudomonas ogarae]